MRLVLFGPPGAGKGTQARMLETRLEVPQIATGDLLRAAVAEGSELGIEAHRCMEQGRLVADDLVLKMVEERLCRQDAPGGFILDGFPRTVAQAEALDRLLAQRGEKLDRVVLMKVDDEEIVKRITGRRTCAQCGAIFHEAFEPPRQPGRCDACGGELYQREDDAEETVRKRLRVYVEAARPLVNYYVRSGLLATVDAVGSAEEVGRRILKALGCNSEAEPRAAKAALKAGG